MSPEGVFFITEQSKLRIERSGSTVAADIQLGPDGLEFLGLLNCGRMTEDGFLYKLDGLTEFFIQGIGPASSLGAVMSHSVNNDIFGAEIAIANLITSPDGVDLEAEVLKLKSSIERLSIMYEAKKAYLEERQVEVVRVSQMAGMIAGSYNCRFEVSQAGPLDAGIDPVILLQILEAVKNASKVQEQIIAGERYVGMHTIVGESEIRIIVIDKGPGIPASEIHFCFQPGNSKTGSTGNGLYFMLRALSEQPRVEFWLLSRSGPESGLVFNPKTNYLITEQASPGLLPEEFPVTGTALSFTFPI